MSGPTKYGLGIVGVTVASGVAVLEVIAHASRGFTCRIVQVQSFTAAASLYAISRPAARGITPTGLTSLEALANDSTPPRKSLAQVATGWGTPPTTGSVLGFLATPAAIGQTSAYAPGTAIIVMPGQALCVHNSQANGANPLFTLEIEEVAD